MKDEECVVGALVISSQILRGLVGKIGYVDRSTFSRKIMSYGILNSNSYWVDSSGLAHRECFLFCSLNSWEIYEPLVMKTHSKECPCGIYRNDCEYHK